MVHICIRIRVARAVYKCDGDVSDTYLPGHDNVEGADREAAMHEARVPGRSA